MFEVNCLLGAGVHKIRFKVSMVMRIQNIMFCVTTSCGLVGGYQRFGATFCLPFQFVLIMETADSSESWYLLIRLRAATTQKDYNLYH
jgi:hypothetical protein